MGKIWTQGEQVRNIWIGGEFCYERQQIWNFSFTGNVQNHTLQPDRYRLECWGGEGFTQNRGISMGGYSRGEINITTVTSIVVRVGGYGSTNGSSGIIPGGWNGGGNCFGFHDHNNGSGGGGGGSGFVWTSTTPSNVTSSTTTDGTWLLNSSHWLTNTITVQPGQTGFVDNPVTTGHSYVRITSL